MSEYGWFSRNEALGQRFSVPPGRAVAGIPIGIVVLDLSYPYLPGNVANAMTYSFPVHYRILEGCTIPMIMRADASLLDPIIEAGHEFERQGIRAMVGACGYFANYQREVAAALDIPVFLSSLLQVPAIHMALKPGQKVGILFADASSVNDNMLEACGVSAHIPIAYKGMEGQPEFRSILDCTGSFDYEKLEGELVNRALALVGENPDVGAILLECSDMPPFAWAIQRAVKMPVFDFNTMINWIYRGVVQQMYQGFQ